MSLVAKGEEGSEERPIWRERVMDYDVLEAGESTHLSLLLLLHP